MMTASARRVDSPHATTPREAEALQKMAAVAGAAARDPDTAAGDENKPANGVTKAPKPTTKKPSSKGDQKQQPSESDEAGEEEDDDDNEDDEDDDDKSKSPSKDDNKSTTDKDDDDDDKKSSKKSRRELPPHTVAILKGWMLSPEHVKHPYPTDEDKQMLLKKTGINMKQLTNWFTNARKRIWKPMMRREHSRQLQTAMEYEKARPRDAFPGGPVPAMPPYRDGGAPYPPRTAIRHSFDAGSLAGPPPYHHHPYDMAPPPPPHPGYGVPPHAAYPPRVGRSVSESGYGEVVEDHMDAMRIRKRPHEMSPDGVDGGDGLGDKRYRRTSMLSPRCLKILQDWVVVHAHMEYPVPSDSDKLQLSRDTGLDVQQIELWFKTNVGRYGVPLQQAPPPMPQQQAPAPIPHGHPAYRSIPTRDNPMYPPPPAYGERRSIPGQGNPMFPPRPSPSVRSSIPGAGNPQFPPPPAVRREASEGYRPGSNMPRPGYPGYPPHPHQGFEGEAARPMRTMSINSAQYGHPAGPGVSMPPMPTPVGAPGGSASGLPSLTGRSMVPGARPGPPMGQARDSRSHTLDMGQFAESRRRNMNFQDILASTSSPAPVAPRPSMGANGYDATRPPNAENMYPTEVAAPYTQKMYEPSRNPSPSVPHPDVASGEPQAPR